MENNQVRRNFCSNFDWSFFVSACRKRRIRT
jgi:hypothetical protein